jgi:hypothetical protein
MGVHSGRFAVVNGQKGVRTWSINDTSAPVKYVASNTKHGTGRRPGIQSWTGSFGCYGVRPIVMPGSFFDFKGYTSPDDDVSGDGVCYEGQAIVDSIVLNWNWQTAEIINHVVNFSGHLSLTITDTEYSDATVPDFSGSLSTKVQWCVPAGEMADWENLVSAALTISCPSVPYVNSSTLGLTGRKAGPAIDWTLSMVEQETTRGTPNLNAQIELKMFDSLAAFWSLKWGIVKEFTGITVDRETGAIIQRTCNIEWMGFDAAGVAGEIKLPAAGSTFWPA